MIQMSEALSADTTFWVRAVIFSAFIATIVSYIVSRGATRAIRSTTSSDARGRPSASALLRFQPYSQS